MIRKMATGLAVATACLSGMAALPPVQAAPQTQVWTNGPQVDRGDLTGQRSARRDVIESRRYTHLLETNHGFRANRERKECGPITDAKLHAQCLASFARTAPRVRAGSSAPAPHYRSGSGK